VFEIRLKGKKLLFVHAGDINPPVICACMKSPQDVIVNERTTGAVREIRLLSRI
jgi:hypothetical protein